MVVTGASSVVLRNLDITGGTDAGATGVLVRSSSTATITGSTVDNGTPTGAGNSADGVRAAGQSTVTVTSSQVVAQAGVAGTNAPAGTGGPAGLGLRVWDNGTTTS